MTLNYRLLCLSFLLLTGLISPAQFSQGFELQPDLPMNNIIYNPRGTIANVFDDSLPEFVAADQYETEYGSFGIYTIEEGGSQLLEPDIYGWAAQINDDDYADVCKVDIHPDIDDVYEITLEVYLSSGNSATGLLAPSTQVINITSPDFISSTSRLTAFFIDMDNDGLDDLLLANEFSSFIWFLHNNNGTFQLTDTFETGYGLRFFEATDFDNDGDKDVMFKNSENDDYCFRFFQQTASFQFTQLPGCFFEGALAALPGMVLEESVYSFTYGLDDFNADGLIDIVFVSTPASIQNGTTIDAIAINNGDLTFDVQPLTEDPWLDRFLPRHDFDNDGDLDVLTTLNNELIYRRNEGNNCYSDFSLYSPASFVDQVMTGDFDQDGDVDMLHDGGGAITTSVYWENTGMEMIAIIPSGIVQILSFPDYNLNGIQDANETSVTTPVLVDSEDLQLNTSSLLIETGTHEFVPAMNDAWWTSTPQTGVVSTCETLELIFALTPVVLDTNITAGFFFEDAVCGGQTTGTIHIVNYGTTLIDTAVVEFILDTMYTYVGGVLQPDSIVANHFYWTLYDLSYLQSETITFDVITPAYNHEGEIAYSSLSLQMNGETIESCDLSTTVECSADPNDITVQPAGYTSAGYILPATQLMYTIRFQNTGSAPAQDVRIEDVLDPSLDATSVFIVESSNLITSASVNENGLVVFHFENIMLPDSAADEPGSHGYITFTVDLVESIAAGTVVPNTVNIFFDLNPPVQTNIVTNTLFDCSWMEDGISVDSEICESSGVNASAINAFFESVAWTVEEQVFSDPVITLPADPGVLYLSLEVINPICSSTTNFNVTIHAQPIAPILTQVENELMIDGDWETIQWFMNDEELIGQNSNVLPISGSGTYAVQVTDQNGCDATSPGQSFTITSIDNGSKPQEVKIYPNPALANSSIIIDFGSVIQASICILDVAGKCCYQEKIQSNKATLNSSLVPGIYYVNIESDLGRLVCKLVVE